MVFGNVTRWLLMLLAMGVAQAQAAEPCQMFLQSSLPIHEAYDGWLVDAKINDKPAQLVFDTGSFTSTLSNAATDRLGVLNLQAVNLPNVSGVAGEAATAMVMAKKFELGAFTMKRIAFMALKLHGSDGILSTDLFSKFDVDLDIPEQKIMLFGHVVDCRAPQAALGGSLYQLPLLADDQFRRPRVSVLVNGIRTRAVIDTGSDHIYVFSDLAHDAGLTPEASNDAGKIVGVGERVAKTELAVVKSLDLGDLSLENLKVEIVHRTSIDQEGVILGRSFLRAVHVWISNSSNTLIMQFPAEKSPKPAE